MKLSKCCESYVMFAEPKVCKEGTFKEVQKCQGCTKRIAIEFTCVELLGSSEPVCEVVGADYITHST